MLKGKTVLLGVTGGIAAYKAAALASLLIKQHAAVEVVMTKNATQFVTPLTFEQLTGRRTMVDTFDRNFSHQVEHISLAQRTDLVIIAPATANVCAKLAHGLADDMLTTTVLACRCPKLIAPAMNTNMYENPVTQDNLALLEKYGWEVISPASGRLACGAVGAGQAAGAGGFIAAHPAPSGASPRPFRQAGARQRRPHPGGHRPGAISDEPLHWKNGLRPCQNGHAPGSRRDPGFRPHGHRTASLPAHHSRGVRSGYV